MLPSQPKEKPHTECGLSCLDGSSGGKTPVSTEIQNNCNWSEGESQSCPTLWPHRLHSPWNSPGQNTGVGSLSLLQGIFPTQGWNPGLPHCRQILYQLSYQGSPTNIRLSYNNIKWCLMYSGVRFCSSWAKETPSVWIYEWISRKSGLKSLILPFSGLFPL